MNPLIFLKPFWKEILGSLIILFALYQAYDWCYDRGYKKAEAHYIALIKDREDARDEKINQIEQTSIKLMEVSLVNGKKNADEIRGIKIPEGKGTTIMVGKDCYPSPEFVQAYNSAINKANSK